ncbi:hypothetical protein QVD17_10042 [Tagetes erecta]|uniref:FAS1 domain-containing protein n=1 Tax=Tagetes erecta TaxID=13708 RepID=A0AAD8L5H9_TARER|nr:hypothetical protein QVD17_10042 [Tagetes erecta]
MGKGIFFTSATMVLAVILTATLRHNHHRHPNGDSPSSTTTIYTPNAASKLLRSNGFNFIANFLHISPPRSTTPQTIFAIPDSAISNLSVPPYMIKHLLAYHISPTKLTIQDLFNKPLKTCLPTLIQHQTVSITKKDNKKRLLEINNVLITHPDLFLHQSVTIHGVAASFASFDPHQQTITLPICESESIKDIEWGRIVKLLGSSGFTAFAIGLKSMSEEIVKDFPDLNSVTIFAPPNVDVVLSSSPNVLDQFMRFHIVSHRHSFKQLAGLASLSTLVTGKHVDITRNENSKVLSINGVPVTAPDLFVSPNFIVHGIARALNMHQQLSSMSR